MLTAPHEAAQFIAVKMRHHRVRNYYIDGNIEQDLHCLETVGRRKHLIASPLKYDFQVPPQGTVVLGQKHTNAFALKLWMVHARGCCDIKFFSSDHLLGSWEQTNLGVFEAVRAFEGGPSHAARLKQSKAQRRRLSTFTPWRT